MGTFINVMKTIFTSSGVADVTSDAERAGRSMTRLGQSSASAGRQFAAQSKGLGGLVAAYAGAAATSFALQAAFTGLANAARSIQTVEGLTSLAAASGLAGQEILASTQKITKGQLSLVESAQQVNLALSAGFNTSQIEGLSEVALKASRALGRDLGDAYTRVVRGSAKMETELLDELGIYTKIEPATRAYALAIGKTVSQLTEYERRQAFVNAVVAEGQRKFSAINTTIPTAAEKIEAFGKRIIDLGTQLGAFLAERLAPLADFFTNNLAASIGAFGALGGLVLGKALSEIKTKILDFQHYVEKQSKSVNERLLKLTKASAQRVAAAQTAVAGISLAPKGTTGIRDELKSLKVIAAQRALSTQELSKAQAVLQRRVANLNALRAAEIQQIAAARQARAAAVQGSAAYDAAKQTLTTLGNKLNTTNTLLAATTTQLNAVSAAATSSNATMAKFFSAVVLRGGLAVAAVARLSVAMVGLGGFVLSAASIIGILGSAIANAVGKGDEFNAFVKGLGDSIKNIFDPQVKKDTRNVFQGLTAGVLSNLEETNQELRNIDSFKFRQKKVLGITIQVEKTKEELVKEVSKLLSDVSLDDGIDVAEAASTGTFWGSVIGGALVGGLAGSAFGGVPALIGALGGAIAGGVSAIFAQVGDAAVEVTDESLSKVRNMYSKELGLIANNPLLGSEVVTTAEKALAYLEDQYGAAAKLDPVAKAYLDTQKQIVLESVKYQKNVSEIATIIAATGKSADQIVDIFDPKKINEFASSIKSTPIALQVELVTINKDKLQDELSKVFEIKTIPTDAIDKSVIDSIRGRLQAGGSIEDMLSKVQDPEVIKFLQELNNQTTEVKNNFIELGTTTEFINIGQSFSEAITAGEGINAVLLRSTDLFITLSDGIATGTLSLEQFSQGVSNISGALITAQRSLPDLNEKISNAAVDLANAQFAGEDVTQYEAILNSLFDQKAAILSTIDASKAQLVELKNQEESLKRQIELTTFLKDQGKGVMSDIELQLELVKASADNAAVASAKFFDSLLQSNKAASVGAENYSNSIKDIIKTQDLTSTLNEGELQAIFAASTSNVEKTKNALKDVENGLISVNEKYIQIGNVSIPLVEQASQDALSVVALSSDAMKKLAQQAAIDVVSLSKKFTESVQESIAEVQKSIDELGRDQQQKQLRFEIDMIDIQAQGAQAAFEFQQAFKENQIKQIELNVDLKKITPVQGATEINALEADIQGIRSAALEAERVAAAEKYLKEAQLRQKDKEAAIATITMEANATKAKITAEFEVIKAAATTYQAIATQLGEAIVGSGNQLGETLVSAAYAAAQTLASAFGPIGKLLGVGTGVKRFDFAKQAFEGVETVAASVGAVGVDAYVEQVSSPVDKAMAEATEGLAAANAAQDKLIKERIAATEADFAREKDLADARYRNQADDLVRRASLLAQEKGISQAEAEKRLRDAEGAGGGADKAAKDLEKLTGRVAELKSAFQSAFESAFMGLNTLIITGEGSIREILGSLFMSIQEEVFKQTIATPLSNWISSWLVGGIQKAFSNKDILGSPLSGVVGSLAGSTGDALQKNIISDRAVDAGAAAFASMGNKINNAITGAAATVQAAGSIGAATVSATGTTLSTATSTSTSTVAAANTTGATTLMSSLGPILAVLAVIAVIASLFGKKKSNSTSAVLDTTVPTAVPSSIPNSGITSVPHFAAGGMLRDRVPALLEPGEFVIRKPIAKQLGTPALQAINANGKTPTAAPVININNEGSQKEVESAKPRFDGEKYVIDIIMRDLANNGPIRKSLRGGAI